MGDFLSRVTLKFDGWPWKTIGHLSYATSSFVHHFIAIGQFKLELQSGNSKFGSKSAIFSSLVTLKFDRWPWIPIGHLSYATSSFVYNFIAIRQFKLELQSGNAKFGSKSAIICHVWPWNLTDDLIKQQGTSPVLLQAFCIISEPSVISSWSYSPETPNLGQNRRFFAPCDLEIWQITLKNNRAPLLSCFKLCAWFHCHIRIQTWVTVRKRLSWVLTSVTLTFDLWPWTFCMDITFVNGNDFWKFRDDTMTGTWWKRCNRLTDRQTDGRLWRIWSQLPWSKLHRILASSFLSSSYREICVRR